MSKLQTLKAQGLGSAEIVLSHDNEWNGFCMLYDDQITSYLQNDENLGSILMDYISVDKNLIILG